MRHRLLTILGLVVVALLVGACARAADIPAGAQRVHVTVSDTAVTLSPTTVRPGDVYLILDAPSIGNLVFVSRGGSPETALTSADLARLARGDTEATSVSGLGAGGCGSAQDAEDRGKLGECGNVMKVVVVEGLYAILADSPETNATRASPLPMGVLEVRS